ncbi:MAG: site-specific DNA-methyltransferase [Thermoplasmata archaeon]
MNDDKLELPKTNFHMIINMHVLDALKKLPDDSIDIIITSPPYYGLRNYPIEDIAWNEGLNYDAWYGQLGQEPTAKMYLDHLLLITKELKRVLKPSGTMFWNMGDSYGGAMGKNAGWDDIKNITPDYDSTRLPIMKREGRQKSLMLLPERLAIRMEDEQDWYVRNMIIWNKPNHMPSSVLDRFSNAYEFVIFATKSKKYYFNLDFIRKNISDATIKHITQDNIVEQFQHGKVSEFGKVNQNMNTKNMIINMQKKYYGYFNENISDNDANSENGAGYNSKYNKYEYGQRKQGFTRNRSIEEERKQSRQDAKILFPDDLEAQQEYINYIHDHACNLNGANPGDVLKINTKPFAGAHFAVFPSDLVETFLLTAPKEVCTVCGTPKTLKTEHYAMEISDFPKSWSVNKNGNYGGTPHKNYELAKAQNPSDTKRRIINSYLNPKNKILWTGCEHNIYAPAIVLDPFAGSGTTSIVGLENDISTIAIEISSEYCDMIKQRMNWNNKLLDAKWIFISNQENVEK